MTKITNVRFGELVGCDGTMVSRMRCGHRLPSRATLEKIVIAFGENDPLFGSRALRATSAGPTAFAEFLKTEVFERDGNTKSIST